MAPTDDDKDDVLLAGRYGDLDDIREFVSKFGSEPLAEIRDENDNCILHMVCGNGHLDILEYLLPLVPSSLLAAQNSAKSTPLHWAALNKHLSVVQRLVEYPDGPGIDLIDIKNAAGHTPIGEAELAEWDEGATWLVKMMNLDAEDAEKEKGDAENVEDDEIGVPQDIEVEIEDAEGEGGKNDNQRQWSVQVFVSGTARTDFRADAAHSHHFVKAAVRWRVQLSCTRLL